MGAASPIVLVVDDEESIRRFLCPVLANQGFEVVEAATGEEALAAAAARPPQLVVLDLGLPDVGGQAVLERLRTRLAMPVIILSAMGAEADKVAAFDAGADDYLTKPFGVGELSARVRAVMRRSQADSTTPESRFAVGDLMVDFTARRVFLGGADVHLTPIEYKLLSLMARNAGKVLTHRQLLTDVWGPEYVEEMNSLRVFMAGLRRKIEKQPAQPRYLITDQGVGYRLADE
jgi:two-component system, OmpR family, KDP operon response regulator KdpE